MLSLFLQILACTILKGSRIKPAKVRPLSSCSYPTCPGTSVKVGFFSDDASLFSSGATSPTVYGVGGPPGGAVGSPGQKRSVSGTGNTLKVIRGNRDRHLITTSVINTLLMFFLAALVDQSRQEAQSRKSRRTEETFHQNPETGQQTRADHAPRWQCAGGAETQACCLLECSMH